MYWVFKYCTKFQTICFGLSPLTIHFFLKNQPFACLITTSFPGSSLLLRKDPGWGWSRVTRKFDRPRGSRQSIKLHASTFALYTSIARSECFVPINFENHIYFKILAKFDLCLLLNYNNMLNRFS
jgi:hypothetical protein